jgi:hypothetical protein
MERYPAIPAARTSGDVGTAKTPTQTLFASPPPWRSVSSSSPARSHEEPINAAIVELSFRSATMEESGRQFMAEER